jgi:hypothetical protein
MNFLQEVTQDSIVREYLKDFPETDWKEVIKKTLLYGIHSLKALENLGLASPRIEKIPALQSELAEMRKNIADIETTLSNNFPETKDKKNSDNSRINIKSRGISQRSFRDKVKNTSSALLRGNSKDIIKQPPFKLAGKEKPEVRRKLPNYLRNVDSKIKNEIIKFKKESLNNNSTKVVKKQEPSVAWEEWKISDRFRNQIEDERNQDSQASSSSFSTYNAGDDVKEFFQKEFPKLLPGKNEKKKTGSESSGRNFKMFSGSPNSSTLNFQ